LGIFEDEQKIQGKGRKQKISKVMGMRPTPAETKKSNQLKQLQTLREVGRIPFLEYKQLREQIANGDVKGAAAKVLQEKGVEKVQVKKEKEEKKEEEEEEEEEEKQEEEEEEEGTAHGIVLPTTTNAVPHGNNGTKSTVGGSGVVIQEEPPSPKDKGERRPSEMYATK